jgi:CheY-like chemotaxis protein
MDLSALRILIVDDNRQAAEIVKTILMGVGAQDIRHVATAHEAFAMLVKDPVDLVILDQNLGRGGHGIELVQRIRNDPSSPAPYLPIMMLTGYADARRVRAARDAGITEFLVKPFTVASLLRRIEALIMQPRNFVRSQDYFGPDRRRRADPNFTGADRRRR